MIVGDFILAMFGKRIAECVSRIMSDQRIRSLSMESPIYTVPELTKVDRGIGDHVPVKSVSGLVISSDFTMSSLNAIISMS